MPKSTLIITRADAAFGHGHLARSLTLAAALRGEGAKVEVLLLGDEPALLHSYIRREKVKFFPSWELSYALRREQLAQAIGELFPEERPQLVVFDMYDFADTYWARRFFSEQFPDAVFVGLDIYNRSKGEPRPEREDYKPAAFSLIINSLLAPFGAQEGETDGVRLLYGTDYLILPPELADSPKWEPAEMDAPIPVFFSSNLRLAQAVTQVMLPAQNVMRSLKELHGRRFVTHTTFPDMVERYIGENTEVKPLVPPKDVYSLLAGSPCAIISAGTVLYEAAHLGVPVAVVPAVPHEQVTARKFADAGYGIYIDGRSNPAMQLHEAIKMLMQPAFAREQSAVGRRLVDGKGLERVMRELRGIVCANG